MDTIFNLIKIKDFKKLETIIKNDDKINLNIYDNNDNYLIYHIIINNQINILKLLLERKCRIDILDFDKRSILYIPIKFNFIEIFNLLLEYNKNIIGISILDIRDNFGLTALHYCVILNNFNFFKLLIDANANPLIHDNSEYNTFHFALKYKRKKIFNYLLEKFDNFDFVTNNNESLIQYALINLDIIENKTDNIGDKIDNIGDKTNNLVIKLLDKNINLENQEKELGLTILHQSIINNYIDLTKKLISLNVNTNIQDYYGNTPLMYAITEKLIDHINIINKIELINYNLTNIYGEIALHLILKNYDFYMNHIDIVNFIIEKSDLNIQNNYGETCLFYLCKNNLLNKFKNILVNKELNIFIKNNNNKCPYDFINNEYINIIVDSFFNYLKINKNKLIIDWEINCFNDIEKCKKQIKKIIIEENRSIPKIKESELQFDSGIFVNMSLYTGAPIDVLCGLLFLYDTFKSKDLNLIIDYPLIHNEELENYFKKLGININYKLDFCNFEINWSFQKIIYPTYFDHEFKNKIKNSLYIIIPIGIETVRGSHANILFYDIRKNIIERFEPNGAYSPPDFNYNSELLDKILETKFKNLNNIRYIKPIEYLPVIGFQILENKNDKRIGDPNGFCAVWCCWWIYHKLKNIDIESGILAEKLIKEIKFKNLNFRTVIRNFSKNVFELRDKFLNKYDIDINDFINDNYNKNILNDLEKDILKFI